MSCMVLDPKHFNSVEYGITWLFCGREDFHISNEIQNLYSGFSRNLQTISLKRKTISEIMDTIRSLSVICVILQNRNRHEGTINKDIKTQNEILFSFKNSYVILDDMEIYKAIQSILYQIEIEPLEELRELSEAEQKALAFLKYLQVELGDYILTKTKEYKEAKWTIY